MDLCNKYLQVAIYYSKFFYQICAFYLFLSSLFRHFTIVNKPTFNLNFYNYGTISKIFITDHIGFYDKYFFKHKTLSRDLEGSHSTLNSRKRAKSSISAIGGSRTAATSKMEAINYYHKALHLGCCSSPRSATVWKTLIHYAQIFIGFRLLW